MMLGEVWRKTSQELMPPLRKPVPTGQYDLYPGFPVGEGKIWLGYEALTDALTRHRTVILDGYGGVFWDRLRSQLDPIFRQRGVRTAWISIAQAMRPSEQIERLVTPFLGGDDPLFGTRFTGTLADFFDTDLLKALHPDPAADVSILYGCGAALAGWKGLLVYVDVPKNEIQFRSRAGAICNLGRDQADDPKLMYKRFYFVDWVALNRHKAELLPRIDLVVDEQRPDSPAVSTGETLRQALGEMSRNYFRVRPWFEPGAWGGSWIKRHIPSLHQDVPNYAWSFELISPENGLLIESDGLVLEVSFDFLMVHDHRAILGDCADRFRWEFPIRFDFLDTWDGGNLSVQCHPSPEYARKHFGESFTQDETYYILDCKPGTQVFLGFQENVDPQAFRQALEYSLAAVEPVDIPKFVNAEPVQKHDLILIPNGTIHCSGEGALVLEISATPYIFTFKMYDWMRLDLDGRPRTLNIDRAFESLHFERKGKRIQQELVSRPYVLAEGQDWKLMHLPTHPVHFYDVHRLEFETVVDVDTQGSCHVLSLVEGHSVVLETASGLRQCFSYAETFVVPAAAQHYRLINNGPGLAKVIKAFVKPEHSGQ